MDYVRNPTVKLLWCPSDQTLPRLLRDPMSYQQRYGVYASLPYPFNYNLSAPLAQIPATPAPGWQHGMASRILNSPVESNPFYFKATSVNAPSQKIVFAENRSFWEMTAVEFNEFMKRSQYASYALESSAWYWPLDQLTKRHSGKGNVTFADGHVQTVRPEFGQMPEHYDPLY